MISDYSFYTDEYHGTLLSEEEFPGYARLADVWMSYYTRDRCFDERLPEETQYTVKLCECAVADACTGTGIEEQPNYTVAKETVGSHSVSYLSGKEAAFSLSAAIYGTISRYLLNTGLLYAGTRLKFVVTSCGSSRFPQA